MDSGDDVYCNSLIGIMDTQKKKKKKERKKEKKIWTQKYKTKTNETSLVS